MSVPVLIYRFPPTLNPKREQRDCHTENQEWEEPVVEADQAAEAVVEEDRTVAVIPEVARATRRRKSCSYHTVVVRGSKT